MMGREHVKIQTPLFGSDDRIVVIIIILVIIIPVVKTALRRGCARASSSAYARPTRIGDIPSLVYNISSKGIICVAAALVAIFIVGFARSGRAAGTT